MPPAIVEPNTRTVPPFASSLAAPVCVSPIPFTASTPPFVAVIRFEFDLLVCNIASVRPVTFAFTVPAFARLT